MVEVGLRSRCSMLRRFIVLLEEDLARWGVTLWRSARQFPPTDAVALLRLFIVIQTFLGSLLQSAPVSVDCMQALRKRIIIYKVLVIHFGVRVACSLLVEDNLTWVLDLDVFIEQACALSFPSNSSLTGLTKLLAHRYIGLMCVFSHHI